jgi:DUF2911 family protein
MRKAKPWLFFLLWMLMVSVVFLVFAPAVMGGGAAEPSEPDNAVCSFEDGKGMSVRYVHAPANGKEAARPGKLWSPGGQPMLLFTDGALSVGNGEVPPGAYAMFLIPGKQEWTLIVSRDVKGASTYDERQDVVRARMEVGELSQAEPKLTIYFGRVGGKVCDMRLDYGKTRAFIDFKEK